MHETTKTEKNPSAQTQHLHAKPELENVTCEECGGHLIEKAGEAVCERCGLVHGTLIGPHAYPTTSS